MFFKLLRVVQISLSYTGLISWFLAYCSRTLRPAPRPRREKQDVTRMSAALGRESSSKWANERRWKRWRDSPWSPSFPGETEPVREIVLLNFVLSSILLHEIKLMHNYYHINYIIWNKILCYLIWYYFALYINTLIIFGPLIYIIVYIVILHY